MRLSLKQWEKITPKVKDISSELPDEFLMIGQWMRAKIIWRKKKYYATGWSIGRPYVDLTEV